MTRRRWIADAVEGDRAFLSGGHAQHLSRVLRARVGQEFDIATPDGVRRGTIASITDDRVEFALGERIESSVTTHVTLLLAIFKFDRLEWAIEKCTELGVATVVPVIARRTETHLAAAAEKRVDRWRKIALQAAEQSRRAQPPEITAPAKLKNALAAEGLRIVLDENLADDQDQRTLPDTLRSHDGPVTLAIGPEGGWTPDELKLFADSGWISASLGETILRAETAAIAATAIVMALRR
jgi:16S rRNA (uracil1498-N3)-methyltransferase